jgi:hypothetical protein
MRSVIVAASVSGLPLRSSQTPSFLKPLEWPSRSSRVLRQSRRAPVPPHQREGAAAQGRHRREPGRAFGTPAPLHHLPHDILADALRRAAIRQSRPRAGQRQARQHPVLYPEGRRHGRAQEKGQAVRDRARSRQIGRARRARLSLGRCRFLQARDVPYPVSLEPNLVVEFYSL